MRNMAAIEVSASELHDVIQPELENEGGRSGVSWSAVVGGALVIAALSLILLALGAGLGLASVSPWAGSGASASTLGAAAILWLIAMQMAASVVGGYLAGRLRTKWTRIHSDEVFFRDTAHGFLAWALAAVLTAAFLATAATSMIGIEKTTDAPAVTNGVASDLPIPMGAYFVDRLFRSDQSTPGVEDPAMRSEAGRLLANLVLRRNSAASDRTYLSHLVAMKTGLSQSDAEGRVLDVIADTQRALDSTRRTAMHLSIWIFIALLCGAFTASVSATIGGSQRDHVLAV